MQIWNNERASKENTAFHIDAIHSFGTKICIKGYKNALKWADAVRDTRAYGQIIFKFKIE